MNTKSLKAKSQKGTEALDTVTHRAEASDEREEGCSLHTDITQYRTTGQLAEKTFLAPKSVRGSQGSNPAL